MFVFPQQPEAMDLVSAQIGSFGVGWGQTSGRVPEGSGGFRRVPEVPEGSGGFRRVPESFGVVGDTTQADFVWLGVCVCVLFIKWCRGSLSY